MPMRVLRRLAVQSKVGWGKTKLYTEIAAGRFPAPVDLCGVTGWIEDEVDSFLEAKVAERDERLRTGQREAEAQPRRRRGRPRKVRSAPEVHADPINRVTPGAPR